MHLREFMDLWALKETVCDKDYEKYGFLIEPGWTVVDIGASVGEFTVWAAAKGAGKVLAVEPSPSALNLLEKNISANGLSNRARIIPVAISNIEGLGLQDTGRYHHGGRSLVGYNGNSVSEVLPVETKSLSQLFEEEDILVCDLMKVDIEGGEYDLFLQSPPSVFDRVNRIVLEFHENLSASSGTRFDLKSHLESLGFVVDMFENKVHRRLGYLRAKRV